MRRSEPEANADCIRRGGNLVSIPDEAANAVLFSTAQENGIGDFWIGLSQEVSIGWKNGDEMIYDNWKQGEPRFDPNRLQVCGFMGHQGRWNIAGRCGEHRSYVCEYETLDDAIAG